MIEDFVFAPGSFFFLLVRYLIINKRLRKMNSSPRLASLPYLSMSLFLPVHYFTHLTSLKPISPG